MQLSQTEFTDKISARRYFREKRAALSEEYRKNAEASICERLYQALVKSNSDTFLFFFPVKGEPDIFSVAEKLLSEGKTLAFPISHTDTLTLEFRIVRSTRDLIAGAYGIPEPCADTAPLSDF